MFKRITSGITSPKDARGVILLVLAVALICCSFGGLTVVVP